MDCGGRSTAATIVAEYLEPTFCFMPAAVMSPGPRLPASGAAPGRRFLRAAAVADAAGRQRPSRSTTTLVQNGATPWSQRAALARPRRPLPHEPSPAMPAGPLLVEDCSMLAAPPSLPTRAADRHLNDARLAQTRSTSSLHPAGVSAATAAGAAKDPATTRARRLNATTQPAEYLQRMMDPVATAPRLRSAQRRRLRPVHLARPRVGSLQS